MGRKKKPTASKKTAEYGNITATERKTIKEKTIYFLKQDYLQKILQKLQAVQAEIDAKETDTRMVKISKDVTAIAEVMKEWSCIKR